MGIELSYEEDKNKIPIFNELFTSISTQGMLVVRYYL